MVVASLGAAVYEIAENPLFLSHTDVGMGIVSDHHHLFRPAAKGRKELVIKAAGSLGPAKIAGNQDLVDQRGKPVYVQKFFKKWERHIKIRNHDSLIPTVFARLQKSAGVRKNPLNPEFNRNFDIDKDFLEQLPAQPAGHPGIPAVQPVINRIGQLQDIKLRIVSDLCVFPADFYFQSASKIINLFPVEPVFHQQAELPGGQLFGMFRRYDPVDQGVKIIETEYSDFRVCIKKPKDIFCV